MNPAPTAGIEAVFSGTPNPPTVALSALPKAASVTVSEVAFTPLFAVTTCAIAPDPSVPPVFTSPYSTIDQVHPVWVSPPKSIVIAPDVGEAPIARNRLILLNPIVSVPIFTQVKPFPVRVGSGGRSAPIAYTHAKTSLFDVGVIEAVVYDVRSTLSPLVVSSNASTSQSPDEGDLDAEGEAEADGLREADGDSEAESEELGESEALGDCDRELEAEGERLALGD